MVYATREYTAKETSAPVWFSVTDFAGVDVKGDKFYIGNVYDKDSKGNYLSTTVEELDERIKDVNVEAADDNAKNYLEITQFKAKGTEAADAFSVSRKSSVTSLVVDTECKVKVVITDNWGMKSEATVTVTLKKFGN